MYAFIITKHCNDLILIKIECKHSTSIFERVQLKQIIATLDNQFQYNQNICFQTGCMFLSVLFSFIAISMSWTDSRFNVEHKKAYKVKR